MNRETRRRLKQNEIAKRPVVNTGASSLMLHERIAKAIDEGIILGFSAASHLFEKVAKDIKGIGDKRAKKIRESFEMELKRIQKELK